MPTKGGEDAYMRIGDYEYEVGDFLKRHPGGTVIEYYVGQDATDAFREFHSNHPKAAAILRTLKRRSVAESPAGKAIPRDHVAEDFASWRADLERRGFFKVRLGPRELLRLIFTVESNGATSAAEGLRCHLD